MLSVLRSSRLQVQVQLWVPFLLTASMLAVPISATAKSIFIGLVLFVVIFSPAYRKDLILMLSQRWCQALLLLFFIALIGCFWSPASDYQKIAVLKKYTKLLYLPFLAVGFRDPRSRRFSILAFLGAMFITCILSILKANGALDFNGPDQGRVFHNHVMTGFMMAFATYLSALLYCRERGVVRLFYAFLVGLFSYQILFISTGRMGYVVYLMLMILFWVQMLSWRKAVIVVILGLSLFTVSYYHSSPMQFVVKQGFDNLREYRQGNKDNAIGFRIQFHAFAKNLFLRHPWFGNGTGSYTYYFRKDDPVPNWQEVPLSTIPKKMVEPHSQYWFVAAEFGMLGVMSLLFFFGSLLVAGLRLHSMRIVAIGLIVSFMVGNLSDSLLFYSGIGYFFLLFMAMCLGEEQQLRTERSNANEMSVV